MLENIECDETIEESVGYSYDVAIIPDVRKLTEFAHYVVELDYLPIYNRLRFLFHPAL